MPGIQCLKALGGAAVDAATGAGGQIVDNAIEGKPLSEGVADAALGSLPGAGLVTAVQQRESCFLAGTSVTLGSGDKQAIETLVIGQRVLTPESVTQTAGADTLMGSDTQVDPATWRSYTVRLRDARTGWDIFDITLLRPAGWMAEHSRPVGGGREVRVDFEELNARGWAEVIEERPCPKIAEGPGRVITSTITHANDDVRTLTMSSGETLYVTGNHRMFSATRADWVAVKDLHIGEDLRTAQGRESVASLAYQRGRHQVYNLEVEAEHCYFVGVTQALSHNALDCKSGLTDSSRWKDELPEGEMRTPEENKMARDYFKNNKEEARKLYEARENAKWPKDATHHEHTRPLKNGGHPLHVEPGYGGPNAAHMKPGPDGRTDQQRWGSLGGKASAAKRQAQAVKRTPRRRR